MLEITEGVKPMLHLGVLTVTGKTLGENLEELKGNGFYEKCRKWLELANKRCGLSLKKTDIIWPYDKPIGTGGSIVVLKGKLAPEVAVIKHTSCQKEMFIATLNACPFDSEEESLDAVLHHKVQKGDAVLIRYEGLKAAGCPRCSTLQNLSAQMMNLGAALR